MKKSVLFCCILIAAMAVTKAQSGKQCCQAPSATSAFASLGNDANFRNAHDAPGYISYAEKGKMISFPTPDGKNGTAYFVTASTKSNNYLVVFHEWWGLNEFIKRQSDLYADSLKNVNVIAVDLYEGQVATDADAATKLMQGVDEKRAVDIVKGALMYAGKNSKIATIGWCFGGGWSMQGALIAGNQLKGCVMYYGMPETDLNKLKTLNSDVLFIWAKKDQWINQKVKDDFVKNMQTAGKKLTVKEYDDDHAFANPSNPHYNKESTADAQKISLNYLRSAFK